MTGPWEKFGGAPQGPWDRFSNGEPTPLDMSVTSMTAVENSPQGLEDKRNTVVNRGMILPFADYADGSTRLALPQFLHAGAEKANKYFQSGPALDVSSPDSTMEAFWDAAPVAAAGLAVPPGLKMAKPGAAAVSPAVEKATQAAGDLAAFENMGVRPFGPAFSQGPVAATAKQLTEAPFIGAPVRSALEESLRGASEAAQNVAGRFGNARTAKEGGDVIEEGIARFKDARPADVVEDSIKALPDQRLNEIAAQPASATSLKTKQGALYERAWRQIPEEMRQGRSVQDTARVMQNPANTRAVLADIMGRNARMTQQTGKAAVGDAATKPVSGGLLGKMIDAVNNPRWTASLQTLRDMRSEFRRLASGMSDTERNTLKLSDLDRIQSSITQDMIALLERNAQRYSEAGDTKTATGFIRSIQEFKNADTFTRQSMEDLERIERLFRAESAEALSRNIAQAAMSGGKGNIEMLRVLNNTLRPEEMGEVAASIISELGKPVASARGFTQDLGFSVSSFMTRYNAMSPEAKAVLFRGEHGKALDDLSRIVNRLANVEALANTSRTTSNAMGVGTIFAGGGAYASGGMEALLGSLVAGGGAALIFSRPQYARWAVKYAELRARAGQTNAHRELLDHVNGLKLMAANDNALMPAYRAVASDNKIQEQEQPDFGSEQKQQGEKKPLGVPHVPGTTLIRGGM